MNSIKIVLNATSPVIHTVILNLKYQGFGGMYVGTGFTLHGNSILFAFIPQRLPIRVRGEEQHNHNINREIISINLTAADDPSIENKMLTIVYPMKTIQGKRRAVNNEDLSHCFPFCNL